MLEIFEQPQSPYVNATKLCQSAGKLWSDYLRLKSTQDLLQLLANRLGIDQSQLVVSRCGGVPQERGSWVHIVVAIDLCRWLGPEVWARMLPLIASKVLPVNPEPGAAPDRAGFVYLIEGTSGICKIGRSHNVWRRRQNLQSSCPMPLVVRERVFSVDCHALESALHAHYAGYRIHGEWFALPSSAIESFWMIAHNLDSDMESPAAIAD